MDPMHLHYNTNPDSHYLCLNAVGLHHATKRERLHTYHLLGAI